GELSTTLGHRLPGGIVGEDVLLARDPVGLKSRRRDNARRQWRRRRWGRWRRCNDQGRPGGSDRGLGWQWPPPRRAACVELVAEIGAPATLLARPGARFARWILLVVPLRAKDRFVHPIDAGLVVTAAHLVAELRHPGQGGCHAIGRRIREGLRRAGARVLRWLVE